MADIDTTLPPTTVETSTTTTTTKKLNGGAVAAIIIVVIIVLALVGFLIYWFVFRKKPDYSAWQGPTAFNASQEKKLESPNKSYYLTFQTDGNLVFYKQTNGVPTAVLWASNTEGNTSAYLDFTSNGNLYIYSDPTKSTIIYSNTTVNGNSGPYQLRVNNTGVFYETNKSGTSVFQFYPAA